MTCPVCIRWVIGLLLCLAIPGAMAADEPATFDPEKIAQTFMGTVADIQALTSIPELTEAKTSLQEATESITRNLADRKSEVEALRKDIKALDDSIQSCHLEIATALGSGNTSFQESQLKELGARRKILINKERALYKAYATCRGQAFVTRIMFVLLTKEIDKRIEQLGNNTASGTWSATYTGDDGSTSPRGGDFSLLIDPQSGAVSGTYCDGGDRIAVSGTRNATSGACKGTGSDPESAVTWSGTLQKGPKGYTGSGSLAFKPKAGGSGAGSWSTK